jgi:hypothetical protein
LTQNICKKLALAKNTGKELQIRKMLKLQITNICEQIRVTFCGKGTWTNLFVKKLVLSKNTCKELQI